MRSAPNWMNVRCFWSVSTSRCWESYSMRYQIQWSFSFWSFWDNFHETTFESCLKTRGQASRPLLHSHVSIRSRFSSYPECPFLPSLFLPSCTAWERIPNGETGCEPCQNPREGQSIPEAAESGPRDVISGKKHSRFFGGNIQIFFRNEIMSEAWRCDKNSVHEWRLLAGCYAQSQFRFWDNSRFGTISKNVRPCQPYTLNGVPDLWVPRIYPDLKKSI